MMGSMFLPANHLADKVKLKVVVYDDHIMSVYYYGVRVGTVRGDTYVTRRDSELHYFWKFDGYGISKAILDTLKTLQVNTIIIIESRDVGERLLVSKLNDWFTYGVSYEHKLPTGESDLQIVLPLSFHEFKI